ncbi:MULTISPECIES: DinB family protein [Bacteroidota]|uniref:DinB family protein n=2 Tax=Sphingobacterium TaxID=28453 RepID=A0ABR7YQZ1_9SPHI|nr:MULTISPECIES: DinB family protein [Sphingobacterium]MBD1427027.1 DinB family protein [Sphingobacterium arenae]MBD1433747.1 DinB family protein [Sphingobacterium micropteri]
METVFKTWKTSRKLYLDFFDKYSLDQLNKIPVGFNNNMIWNIGHIIATQHKLIYKGANLRGYITDELFNKYQSGTKPTESVSQQEADELKFLLTSQIELTINDFDNGIFGTYNERTTGIGFHLISIQDAFACNNYHEGLHLGYMMGIRKFV